MTRQQTRALILAAGRGSRMGKLTADRPKCLLEVGGMSLLDWQLKALRRAGVQRVAAVRGYRGESIRRRGLDCFDNPEWERSGSLLSLLAARSWLEESSCLVCYGDIAYHPDIITALKSHPPEGADISLPYDILWRKLWEERFSRPEADAESFQEKDGRLTEIGARGRAAAEIQGQFMGIFRLSPAGWSEIGRLAEQLALPKLRTMDMTATFRLLLAQGVSVATFPVRGRWCEFDSVRDLELCRKKFADNEDWTHDWRF